MTECRSTELQDLLPDFVADVLDDVTAARVAAHIEACPMCADDLAVLRLVRQARPRVAVPDVARIVSALPAPPVTQPTRSSVASDAAPESAVTLRLVREAQQRDAQQRDAQQRGALERVSSVSAPPSMASRRPRGTIFGRSVLRMAATLGVMIAGGASVMVARRGIADLPSASPVAIVTGDDSAAGSGRIPVPERAETVAVASTIGRSETVSVSYGDLGDYSEDELERMLDRLEQWDGATNTEPLPGVPILPGPGGGTP